MGIGVRIICSRQQGAALDKETIAQRLRLSPSQAEALDIEEDTLLLAGAGAGKSTTLLGALAADLLLRKIPPSELALVTFTRSAAWALRARLEETLYLLGEDVPGLDEMWIGTIDAIAARTLRTFALRGGRDPDAYPAGDAERMRAAREALRVVDMPLEPLHGWIDVEGDQLLEILLRFEEEARGRSPWVAPPPTPNAEAALRPMRELLREITSEEQRRFLEEDIRKIESGEIPGNGKWGMRAKKREKALQAKDLFRQDQIDFRSYPVADTFLELWQSWRREYRARGFGEIMEEAAELIEDPPLQKLYLDEAQDTTAAQFGFLRQLLRGPLVAVGDPNQSIYGFRGADLRNFLQQTKDFPRITLRDNYRSRPAILDAVEEICRPLLGDDLLRMQTPLEGGEVVSYILRGEKTPPPSEEARLLSGLLRRELERFRPEEIAVLFRSNGDLETFYRQARLDGLPVAALRSGGLLLQEECRDLLALLRFWVLADEESKLRVLSSPLCGLSAEELLDWSGSISEAPLPHETGDMLGEVPLSFVLEDALRLFHFDLILLLADPSGARWENVQSFLRALRRAEEDGPGMDYEALLQFFEESLGEERPPEAPPGTIRMQTIHQAKGAEYRVVILPRLGRSLQNRSGRKLFLLPDDQLALSLPGSLRSRAAEEGEEEARAALEAEERRLLYVALTRASERLVLLGSAKEGAPLSGLVADLPGEEDIPELPQSEEVDREEVSDPELLQPEGGLPRAEPRDISWSALRSWNRCSLRRQLEGEWGLGGEEASGGGGKRMLGLEVHRAIAQGDPAGLEGEALLMYGRAREYGDAEHEVPFEFALGSWTIRGRIDWIRRGEMWEIVDWKTGEEEDFHEDYSAQRKIYGLAALRGGAEAVRARTVYLRSGEEEEDTWKGKDLRRLEEEVRGEVEEILSRAPKPATEEAEPFCAGCPGMIAVCPVSKAQKTREEDLPKLSLATSQEDLDLEEQ